MGLYRRGKVWWIDYYYIGNRVREPVGPEKEEARIILGERLKDIRQGRNPELRRIRPKLFDEMVAEFLKRHASQRRDYETFVHLTNVLLRYFRGRTLQEVTPKAIEDFRAARLAESVTKATVNRHRAVLSKLFACAIDWGYFGGENPVRKVGRFQESPGRARHLTANEADSLVGAASRHLKPVIVAALHTGGRRRELLSLRWKDVDLERGVLYFDQTNTKSGKQREIPIDSMLDRVLRDRRKVRAIGGDAREYVFTWRGRRVRTIKTAFETARKGAKLGDEVTFHTLRHTFASWYVINGGDLYRLQTYLGHSTITLTQRYAHLSPEHRKAGVRFFGAPAAEDGHNSDTNTSD